MPPPSSTASDRHNFYPDSSHHRHHPSAPKHHEERDQNKAPEADSDSTIDLPSRFDGQGRPLPERDPAVDKFEDLVNRFTKVLF